MIIEKKRLGQELVIGEQVKRLKMLWHIYAGYRVLLSFALSFYDLLFLGQCFLVEEPAIWSTETVFWVCFCISVTVGQGIS